jgi:hypothetical protein
LQGLSRSTSSRRTFRLPGSLAERMVAAWRCVAHAANINAAGYEFEGGAAPIA